MLRNDGLSAACVEVGEWSRCIEGHVANQGAELKVWMSGATPTVSYR
jgi:hypothetical protein